MSKKANTTSFQANMQLDYLFEPRSIALVGISSDPSSPIQEIFLRPLIDFEFEGQIYPVNPKGGQIHGLKVYPSIQDIPGPVDYAIASVPAPAGSALMQQCAAKGVRAVHFFTAGFSETGEEAGIRLEAELVQAARAAGARVIGPNCMGIYCPKSRLSYWSDFPRESGPVGYLCQSGGNSIHLVQMGAPRGLRFSKVVSCGNSCDLNESDYLEYLAQDPDTEIIAIYIEGVKDGQRFIRVLGEAARAKPVIMLKGGHTGAGRRAVAGHTGALAGSDAAWEALSRQLGVIRVYSLEELADMLVTFSLMPTLKGLNVAVVGVGGGASVLATDDCEASGLTMPPLPPLIRDQLRQFTPDVGNSLRNPVDSQVALWSPDEFAETIKIVSSWDGIDFLIGLVMSTDVFSSMGGKLDTYNSLVTAMLNSTTVSSKPMALVIQPGIRPEMTRDAFSAQQQFVAMGFPVYHTVAAAAKAISRFTEFHNSQGGAEV